MDHVADVVVGGGFAGAARTVYGEPRLGPDNLSAEAFDRPGIDRILAWS